jgi:hypothetical protein
MRSQNRWTGRVAGVLMGVLFSATVVLAGGLDPSVGPTEAGLQGKSSIHLPIVLNPGGSSSAGVPRTGQTTSYGPDDDGALQKGVVWPNPRFTDNANGTVTDNLTGLIWLKNANCFGGKDWEQALITANGLASGSCGLSDNSTAGRWRLPNVKELQSLIDFAYYHPALSNAAGTGKWVEGDPFINVLSTDFHWSSSSYAYNTSDRAWYVGIWFSRVEYNDLGNSGKVWPVQTGGSSSAGVPRTGQTPTVPLNPAPTGSDGVLQKGVAWPNPRFKDNANGTVTDNLTGLIWLKNANCFGKKLWTEALSAANGLANGSCGLSDNSTAGRWRLPNVKELQSLIDFAHHSPALSNVAGTGKWVEGDPFIEVQSTSYWSSSSDAYITSMAWSVPMWSGSVLGNFKDGSSYGNFYVWPVRSEQ